MNSDKLFKFLNLIIPVATSVIILYAGHGLLKKRENDQALLNEVKEIRKTMVKTAVILTEQKTISTTLKEEQSRQRDQLNDLVGDFTQLRLDIAKINK